MQKLLKLLKELPAVDTVRAGIERNQARVIDLLDWNKEKYSLFMYNSGLQYLSKYMGRDADAICKVTPRKEFWNWWKLQWDQRDESFIQLFDGKEYELKPEQLQGFYTDTHNVNLLLCVLAIPAIAYPEDFATIKIAMA